MLRNQSKESQQRNEKLKEKIQELKAEQADLFKWATKMVYPKESRQGEVQMFQA